MYKFLIFDVDGTIADTDEVILRTYIELYKKYEPHVKISKKKILTFSGPPLKETLTREFPDYDLDFINSEYKRISSVNYLHYLKTFKNCREILLKLKKEGYTLALATSKYVDATNYNLGILKFDGIFDYMVCGDEVEHNKPAPDCIIKLLEKTGFKKEETLFIGDTIYDLECAKGYGVNCVIMRFKNRDLSMSKYVPDYKAKTYKKLYNYIINYGK